MAVEEVIKIMKAEKANVGRLLRTARGQIDGILKMIEGDQYCIDVSTQIMSAEAVLRRANREVLHAHMESCVLEAVGSGDRQEAERKLEELYAALEKMLK